MLVFMHADDLTSLRAAQVRSGGRLCRRRRRVRGRRWVNKPLCILGSPCVSTCCCKPLYRPFRTPVLADYLFGLSRQFLIMRDMKTIWGFIYEALPGQFS